MKKKQGISLIVLVITIIVIVILAVAVILSIANNNTIENAKNAVDVHNETTLKEAANIAYLDWYSKDAMGEEVEDVEEYVKNILENQGFSDKEIAKVTVTENGIEIITFKKTGELAIGSEVTASNGEKFYVIGGDTVGTEISTSTQEMILLSKYNLKKENDEIILKQDTSGAINACAFSSTNYWSSVEGITYPADLNDEEKYPIGSATSIITTAKEYGASLGVTGRLITYEEQRILESSYSEILLGENTPSLAYWLSEVWGEDGVRAFYHNDTEGPYFNYDYIYGVRPVIIVSKSLIK